MFDFDTIIDRRASECVKWSKYQGTDILPFWIADMDFPAPSFIQNAILERVTHGIHGYTQTPAGLSDAVVDWSRRYCGYSPGAPDVSAVETLVWLPGVVPAMNVAARTLAKPGSAIATTTPIYYPFLDVAKNSGQRSVHLPLVRKAHSSDTSQQRWEMDFDAMAHDVAGQNVTALLFCNPHNPTGRAYSVAELSELAEFCLRHDIVIISDEIHCPLILDKTLHHTSIAGLAPEVAQKTITLQAPTKAWNLAGTSSAIAIIEDRALRERFRAARAGMVSNISPFAYAAAEAAYNDHSSYLDELCAYLRHNHDLLQGALAGVAPNLCTPVEATYLAWIDVRDFPGIVGAQGAGTTGEYFESRGIGLSDGLDFAGPGYVRFNFAAPRTLLEEGIRRLVSALHFGREDPGR